MRVAASLVVSDNAFSRWKCRDFRWSDSGAAKFRTWQTRKDFRRIATRYDELARNYFSAPCRVAALAFWLWSCAVSAFGIACRHPDDDGKP